MFTGIIETTGAVAGVSTAGPGMRLAVEGGCVSEGIRIGASVAVDGVCLTVSEINGERLSFDVVRETLERSTLSELKSGTQVNLERALAVGDRFDGHFVQGHVDGLGRLVRRIASGTRFELRFTTEAPLMPAIVPKGSIAVSGVSLTITDVSAEEFGVALVPTTLRETNLGDLREGSPVNLETDILARTVLHALARGAPGGITMERLGEHGFL
ncbi:MAG: riboflavin synthase [bacterium]|nr:riboflavin synthase [bacterium]